MTFYLSGFMAGVCVTLVAMVILGARVSKRRRPIKQPAADNVVPFPRRAP